MQLRISFNTPHTPHRRWQWAVGRLLYAMPLKGQWAVVLLMCTAALQGQWGSGEPSV